MFLAKKHVSVMPPPPPVHIHRGHRGHRGFLCPRFAIHFYFKVIGVPVLETVWTQNVKCNIFMHKVLIRPGTFSYALTKSSVS